MTPADILLGAVILAFVAWIGWELYRAPVEDFDQSRAEQETRAEEAADSMRGQLEQMRKDGVL
jgi:predicted negative regulator of RcsB-dependent stress response